MRFSTLIVISALLGGCASQQKMDDLSRQMTELRKQTGLLVRENQLLRQRLLGKATQPTAPAPRRAAVRRGPLVRVVQPPPQPVVPLLPMQEQGYLYRPHRLCASGPFALSIVNQSAYYLRVMVNGKPVSNYGGYGPLPHLPPRQELHVCLDDLGANNISGIAYAPYKGTLRKLKTFSFQVDLKPDASGHTFFIDNFKVEH